MRRKRRLSQQDLRAMGVTPGRLATRYTPDGERAVVRQLTAEAKPRSPFRPGLADDTKDGENH